MILFKPVNASITVLIFNRRFVTSPNKCMMTINQPILFANCKERKNQRKIKCRKLCAGLAFAYIPLLCQ
jgi:hypothetical protein